MSDTFVGATRNAYPSFNSRETVIAETRQLFSGFLKSSPPSERWQTMARRKIVEFDEPARKITATKVPLQRPCECKHFGECGWRIFAKKRDVRETLWVAA